MNGSILALTSLLLGAITLNCAAADLSGQELHAAVTDIPENIDMSHADPKTWHGLPRAGQVYLAEELEFRSYFSSNRTRPF
jgi:hypothetical protein